MSVTWYTYIVECKNGTYYTGITTDITRRINQHNAGKGSKYVKRYGGVPVTLRYLEEKLNRSEASKREWAIKQLTRKEKEQLINDKGI
jgi:putative endonuclease